MRSDHNLVGLEEWELTCIRYKLGGEPKPLDAIDGVLVKNEREQISVEKYLRELYEFQSEKDYQNFVESFIISDNGKGAKGQLRDKDNKEREMKSKSEWVDFKEIKENVSMEEILDHYGLLKGLKRRKDELIGFCPIHDEKHYNKNSFCVSTVKNNWHCFSCGAGGNVLDFVAAMEKVSIREAGLLIQKWFGVVSEEDKKLVKEKRKIEEPKEEKKEPGEVVNPPLTFELKTLDPEHPYLKERGLKEETIREFGLGFCKKGLMKGRIVIPIHNENGELVAYVGRYPGDPPKGESKYKFPPKFKKSLVVFNLNRLKDKTKDERVILVEEFFDVFNLWQAGYKNVVALMGTSMTDDQEKLIVEAIGGNGRVVLMFDSDEAGAKATTEVVERLIDKIYLKIIRLGQEGLQPDSLSEEKIKKALL